MEYAKGKQLLNEAVHVGPGLIACVRDHLSMYSSALQMAAATLLPPFLPRATM